MVSARPFALAGVPAFGVVVEGEDWVLFPEDWLLSPALLEVEPQPATTPTARIAVRMRLALVMFRSLLRRDHGRIRGHYAAVGGKLLRERELGQAGRSSEHVVCCVLMLSDRFRAAVERGEADNASLFSEDVVFRSPVVFKPYEGREQVLTVLRAAERVLVAGGKFRYLHQLEDSNERVAILEFATDVKGKHVEGIDKLSFDEAGLITELKVMLRPASALQVVGAGMAEEFARLGLSPPA